VSPCDVSQEENHVEKARHAIHLLHTAHDEAASPLDRLVERMTGALGRPAALLFIIFVVAAWVAGNLWAGSRALDPFPFPDLELAISALALAIAVLILASQRRADKLADARERITLELSLQSAQKVSKVIELLEEFRRDSPNVPDRTDAEADDMSAPRSNTEILANVPIPVDDIADTNLPEKNSRTPP